MWEAGAVFIAFIVSLVLYVFWVVHDVNTHIRRARQECDKV